VAAFGADNELETYVLAATQELYGECFDGTSIMVRPPSTLPVVYSGDLKHVSVVKTASESHGFVTVVVRVPSGTESTTKYVFRVRTQPVTGRGGQPEPAGLPVNKAAKKLVDACLDL